MRRTKIRILSKPPYFSLRKRPLGREESHRSLFPGLVSLLHAFPHPFQFISGVNQGKKVLSDGEEGHWHGREGQMEAPKRIIQAGDILFCPFLRSV